ncbi:MULTISPECIES: hypothetical protein [Macrococcus]|uniref:Uncharacterized protein n=1 Tax=Macrococcus psychrotolerans TaxID=3039389 RepID=A0AAU6R8L5_9STAP|nr:hypothetical protein [Macrococcus sp. S115]MDJ1112784.1 hypothetical protein [Macrococcus sp. S115]
MGIRCHFELTRQQTHTVSIVLVVHSLFFAKITLDFMLCKFGFI